MSPLVAMWIASILGALLFFAAGYFAAPRRAVADGAGAGLDPDDTESESESKRAREPESDVPSVDEILKQKEELGEAERAVTRLTNERDSLKTVVTELESKLTARVAAHEQLELRIGELETELAKKAEAASQPEDFDDQRTRVRDPGGGELVDELMAKSRGSSVAEHDADVIESLVEMFERRVQHHDTWRAVALADDLGMPVVGAGIKKEALAVFSGLIDLMEMRTRALLPIKELKKLSVEDVDGTVVSTCTLPDRSLSLVTLTENETPSTEAMANLLQITASML